MKRRDTPLRVNTLIGGVPHLSTGEPLLKVGVLGAGHEHLGEVMQLRFAALFAATVLVALSAVFAAQPVGGAATTSAAAEAATYVVVEPRAVDCPWESSSAA